MESDPSSVFRHKKSTSSDRFLNLFSQSPTIDSVLASSTDELHEDDILWSSSAADDDDDDDDHRHHHHNRLRHRSPPPPATSVPSHLRPGILAALPDSRSNHPDRFLQRKTFPFVPSSSSSSSKVPIPSIPKSQSQSQSPREHTAHQSAPVNVPLGMPAPAPSRSRRCSSSALFEEDDDDSDDKMLPPHEIVARSAKSPMTTFSVLEGKGRTLKGRDLRRVRNAVFRQTGFLD